MILQRKFNKYIRYNEFCYYNIPPYFVFIIRNSDYEKSCEILFGTAEQVCDYKFTVREYISNRKMRKIIFILRKQRLFNNSVIIIYHPGHITSFTVVFTL